MAKTDHDRAGSLYRPRPLAAQQRRVIDTLILSSLPLHSEVIRHCAITPAPLPRRRGSAVNCLVSPTVLSIRFFDAPPDDEIDVLFVAPFAVLAGEDTPTLPEHGPSVVGCTPTFDGPCCLTKFVVSGRTGAFTGFGCVALPDTGSRPTVFRREVYLRKTI